MWCRNEVESMEEKSYRNYMANRSPMEIWGDDEEGYINHLMNKPSYEWVNGELMTYTGFKSAEIWFNDLLRDETCSLHHKAKANGWFDWLLMVETRYYELKNQGKIQDI